MGEQLWSAIERDWSFTLLELASSKALLYAAGRLEAPLDDGQHIKMSTQQQVTSRLSVAMVWSRVTKFKAQSLHYKISD
jgi:hypothetical protein